MYVSFERRCYFYLTLTMSIVKILISYFLTPLNLHRHKHSQYITRTVYIRTMATSADFSILHIQLRRYEAKRIKNSSV